MTENPAAATLTASKPTAPNTTQPPCVVGIDSSDNAERAAAWAAHEAEERGAALVLVHAVDLPGGAGAIAEPIGWADWSTTRTLGTSRAC